MPKTVTTRYEVAEHLRTPKEVAAYLEACLEEANGDAAFVAKALGDIARARGMTQVARPGDPLVDIRSVQAWPSTPRLGLDYGVMYGLRSRLEDTE
jgi:hypothetical protein